MVEFTLTFWISYIIVLAIMDLIFLGVSYVLKKGSIMGFTWMLVFQFVSWLVLIMLNGWFI